MKSIERLRRENRTHKQYIRDSDLSRVESTLLMVIAEIIVTAHFIVSPLVYAWTYYNNAVLEEAVSEINHRNLYERGEIDETG